MESYPHVGEEKHYVVSREKELAEKPLIDQLVKNGWIYVHPEQLEREISEPILTQNLRNALRKINEKVFFGVSTKEIEKIIEEIITELKAKGTGAQGHAEIMDYIKYGIPMNLGKKGPATISLIDYEHIDNNEFIVSSQVNFEGVDGKIRPDIVLFVNGLPVVLIECKDPTNPSVSWVDAKNQIKKYENTVPELFKYIQINVVAETWEERIRYFPSVPWASADVHIWKNEGKNAEHPIPEILTRTRLLDIIKYFIFMREESGKKTKVIARYMQYRAANKTVERIKNYIKGARENTCLIWHWQGSGKTLTMIFTANKLMSAPELGNPTIFFILDRQELEEQTSEALKSLKIPSERVTSISRLKEILLWDNGRGKRGMFVVLVHKFREGELEEVDKLLEDTSVEHRDTIKNRKNIVVLVDEADRTQYGVLAAKMRAILENAFFVGYTGTPIAIKGKDTFATFSPPGEDYLDKYFIKESLEDNYTLRIAWEPRIEKEIKVENEKLKEFVGKEMQELLKKKEDGIESFLQQDEKLDEYTEEAIQKLETKVAKRLKELNVVLENQKRIELIAEDIAKHFMENVDGRFKAMVVCASRRACVLYKRALDKHLSPEYSEIVMTYGQNDDEIIKQYKMQLTNKYRTDDLDTIRAQIIAKFKNEEYPKILIVTDMLLRGFDAPVLQTLYLDKPLKGHRLLQTIARANRPVSGKDFGQVIDYVGILNKLEKALEMYETGDIAQAATNVAEVIEEFKKEIE
ncbi:MAG: type I restriction endonuclease subunit R, partial [Thermoplasmata archaeon]